ncbi:DUF1963 domain-containing protein [Lysobacter firmicutimachus]|uniref:DUF1963 domain-containing protein n=1 Tax=Lysobacter firmicutimachus TaxID=1792846 RepID=A0AAU8MQG1_9GAMM|nr:DUF1963 domain-containing protein [Lysobacter antibioticus]
MKTGQAVLLSIAIVAAAAAALGGVGYVAYRQLEGKVAQRSRAGQENAAGPMHGAAGADRQAAGDGGKGGGCAIQDHDARARAVLAPVAAAMQTSQRPVARIELSELKTDALRLSKVGGRAYWAAGRDYPRDPQGRPLFLLAQLDFAELPVMPGYPQQGLLQFFVSADDYYGAGLDRAHGEDRMQALAEQRGFRVVYWPRTDAPAVAPPAGTAAGEGLPFDPARPRRIRFVADHETIGGNDAGLERAIGRDIDGLIADYRKAHPEDEAEDVADDVAAYLDRAGHKLGGYPDFTQSDPRAAGDERVLLLQLDSDEDLMWGDSGIANFFIDPDDLARADFSRVAYHWDCY